MSTRRLLLIWALLLAGIFCLAQQPTKAYWQSRDSNYNIAISGGGGGSVVALDQAQVTDTLANGSAGTIDSTANITVSGGLTNSLLVATIGLQVNSIPLTGVAWDPAGANQAMTVIGAPVNTTAGTFGRVEFWGLLSPTAGTNKVVRLQFGAGSQTAEFSAISFQNVDQTGGTTTFPNYNTVQASSNSSAITITSATTQAAIALILHGNNFTSTSIGQTKLFLDNTAFPVGVSYLVPATASVAFAGTSTGGGPVYAAAGFSIKAH